MLHIRRPLASFVGLATLATLGACAHAPAPKPKPPAPERTEAAYGTCSETKYVARGHLFAGRLVCPDDTLAQLTVVGTKMLPDGRFLDAYVLSCPSLGKVSFDAPVDCSEPEVPAGLRLIPAEAARLWLQGRQLHWKEADYPAALDALERASALAPEVADIHALRGLTLAVLDRRAEGVEALDRALAKAPDRFEWRVWRGAMEFALSRPEQAVADLQHAAQVDPKQAQDSRTVQVLLGKSLLQLGREDEALPHRRRACELGHAQTCSELGLPAPDKGS